MKPGFLLARLIHHYHERDERERDAIRRLREELRKSYSPKGLTAAIKARMIERRTVEKLRDDLLALERELSLVKGEHDERAQALRERIRQGKKKIGSG